MVFSGSRTSSRKIAVASKPLKQLTAKMSPVASEPAMATCGSKDENVSSPAVTRELSTAASQIAPIRSRSEEHTSELQSLMRISYHVFCLKKTKYMTLN